jgi:hypothetical protein
VVSFFFLKQLKYTLLVELIQLEQLFRNNTGGTFNVTGFSTGTTDTLLQELIQLEQLCLETILVVRLT